MTVACNFQKDITVGTAAGDFLYNSIRLFYLVYLVAYQFLILFSRTILIITQNDLNSWHEIPFNYNSEGDHNFSKKEDTEVPLETLEDKLTDIVSQIAKAEEAHQKEENIYKQVIVAFQKHKIQCIFQRVQIIVI